MAKKSTPDAIKTALKRVIQRKKQKQPVTWLVIEIADKITSISKMSSVHSSNLENDNANDELEVTNKRYISPGKR